MPGINIYYNFAGLPPFKRTVILDHCFEDENHNCVNKALLEDKNYIVTGAGYDGYPFMSYENENFRILLEGCIYNHDEAALKSTLDVLSKMCVDGDSEVRHERIRSWLLHADGEFIVFIHHKNSGVVRIITDALGRLPFYYSRDDQSIMLSRHMDLIVKLYDRKEYSQMGIAQYLLFAYSLGTTTLVKDIYRLEPSGIVTIDPSASVIDIRCLDTFCFAEKIHSSKTLRANAAELARLLSVACSQRANSKRCNVMALSGGLDSRTVAACIRNQGIPMSAATMIDSDGTLGADEKPAEQIARVLGIDWKLFRLQAPTGKDAYRLLSMKSGLNYLSMSFILQFFDQLRNTYGREMAYITGDGGDKVLVDLRPKKSLRSLLDLVNYIVARNQIFPVEDVSRMTGIPVADILDGISKLVGSYPEPDWESKYVHFVISERGRRWLFEGEDRNRNFFWHLAPFYSIEFFCYAMNCPDEQKSNHKLYKEVLLSISPPVSNINNGNWGFQITSRRYGWMMIERYVKDLIPTQFKKLMKQRLLQKCFPRERYIECVTKQVTSCNVLRKYLILPEMIKRLGGCTKREAQTLLTVTSTLELLASDRSTLKEQYWDVRF